MSIASRIRGLFGPSYEPPAEDRELMELYRVRLEKSPSGMRLGPLPPGVTVVSGRSRGALTTSVYSGDRLVGSIRKGAITYSIPHTVA